MSLVELFNSFAADFEACIVDDQWKRLGKYFSEDATYWNVGGPGQKIRGNLAIIESMKSDVSNFDRRFDARRLEAVTEPTVVGNRLSRKWRCTYKLAGAPDLVVEGEARYLFAGSLICSLEEEITPGAVERYAEWMKTFGSRLVD